MSTLRARPLADLLRLFIGPAVWFGHFTVLYGAEALICTPPAMSARAMTWVAFVVTIAALIALGVFAASVRRPPPEDRKEHPSAAFLHTVALLLVVFSTLGVAWTALPAALLPVCAPPAA